MKILLTLDNPPEGMNESQLFDDKAHLNTWMEENKRMIGKFKIKSDVLTCEKGLIETKADDFKNYAE